MSSRGSAPRLSLGPAPLAYGAGSGPILLAAVAVFAAAIGVGTASNTLLFGVAVAAILVGVCTLLRPDALIPITVYLVFLNAPSLIIGFHGLPLVLGLACVGLLAIPMAQHLHGGARLELGLPGSIALAFVLAQVVSATFSSEQAESFDVLTRSTFEGFFLFVALATVLTTPARLLVAMWSAVAAGASLGALSLLQYVTGAFTTFYGGLAQIPSEFLTGQADSARLAGPVRDPNYYAQFMLILFVFAVFGLARSNRGHRSVGALVAAGLIACGVVLTFSRGAALAMLIGLVAAVLLRAVRLRQVLMVIATISVVLVAVPAYGERVSSVGSAASGSESEDESVRARTTEMSAAFLAFSENPVIGLGPQVFKTKYQFYADRVGGEIHTTDAKGANRGEAPERQAHNLFLSIAAELGIVGLVLFLALLGTTIHGLLTTRRLCGPSSEERGLARMCEALILGIVVYCSAGLFLTLAFERYFWSLLGLSLAAILIGKRLRTAGPPAGDEPGGRGGGPPAQRRSLRGA